MQEFIVNVYVSLIRLRRNNYQDFALPLYPNLSCTRQFESKLSLRSFAKTLYPSLSCTRHNIQASLMFCARLQRLCTPKVPLTPNLIYWKQYKYVYIT